MKFAKQHYKLSSAPESESGVWNGRQIMNAFKVALALARWDTYNLDEQDDTEPLTAHDDQNVITISAAHLNIYAGGIRAFDSYLKEATGSNDADRAFNAQERADEYESEDNIPLRSPRLGDVSPFPAIVPPYEELRRTSSMGLVPPPTNGRASSPNLRPQLPARHSSSQLLQQQRSATISRHSGGVTPIPVPQPRRRSSQLTPAQLSPPVTRRRPSTERRGSGNNDFRRQNYFEHDDTGVETEETDSYLYENEVLDDDSDSGQ